MLDTCRVLLLIVCSVMIWGCSTLTTSVDAPSAQSVDIANNQATETVEIEVVTETEPPNKELDAQLLEQLMITNFASYAGDWSSATSSAISAAELSQDYRLARMASVLALRSSSYAQVSQASELWYKLDQDNEDAYNTLLIGLVGSGNVDRALVELDKRLLSIEQAQLASELSVEGSQSSVDDSQSSVDDSQSALGDDVLTEPIDIHIRQTVGLLVRQQNADSAINVSEEYVRRYPDSAQVLLSAAYVANYFEQDDKAEQWLNSALQLRPNWDVAAQMYMNMLARQGKQAERSAYIRSYLEDNPQSVAIRIQYAAELVDQEDYQGALEVMQEVVVDDPNNSGAIIYTAALAQQLEQESLAEDYYHKALALEPSNNNVLWSLAAFAINNENYRKAEQYYARISPGETYFRAQIQVANMRYETRGIDSAINVLRRLQPRTEGEFIEIALSRHYLLMQENQYEEALGYINDSLVYLPESDDLVYARALVAAELEKVEIAENDFRAIIARNPEHANALNAFGYTLADQTDRYEEAKGLILRALALRPKEGHILDSMGWVLYRLEDYESAISYLQQAFDVMPEAEIAAHLGEVYWEDGQQDQARDIWQKAYELDDKNLVLLETLKRFDQLELYAKQTAK